ICLFLLKDNRFSLVILCILGVPKTLPSFLCLSGFFPLHPMTITNAERLRKRRALKAITASEEETPGD
ncbi:unnamed protein product, partial [Eretmochelys imbricata]